MDRVTREFIKIALTALQNAVYNESKGYSVENEDTKEIARVTQEVGDLSRRP